MYPPCWVLKARIQKQRGKPLLFHDKCPGFFYVHYTTHGTYSFTSHPKDEAIMVKCLAQGHKSRDRPGRDSNPHSDNTRTWVQWTRPLSHDTPCMYYKKTTGLLQVQVAWNQLESALFMRHYRQQASLKLLGAIPAYPAPTQCIMQHQQELFYWQFLLFNFHWIIHKFCFLKGKQILNPFASGIKKVLLYPIMGLFSVKIWKKFLAIKNFSVNDTMSGQPNKRLIHWHFEN